MLEGSNDWSETSDFLDVESKIEDSVRVAPFVVVPRNNLVEVLIETNSCLGIENWRSLVVLEILRDNLILSESENSLWEK